jgi:hypothetical protein
MGQIQGHHECAGCGLDHRGADGTCEWSNDPQFPGDKRTNDQIGNIPDANQQGPSPDLTKPGPSTVRDRRPHIVSNETGPSEDSFEVYRGRVDYPLDAPAVWRYVAKDALDDFPELVAVEQFRNAIKEAGQQSPQKP